MKSDFLNGMGNINLFPTSPKGDPVSMEIAFSNVRKSFSNVANTMNLVFLSEGKKVGNAKSK